MTKRLLGQIFALLSAASVMLAFTVHAAEAEPAAAVPVRTGSQVSPVAAPPPVPKKEPVGQKDILPEKGPQLSDEEIALIALVTMAEAEGECEEGKRLVIDTVLNRVDDPRFPDTVSEVIYQPNQFTSMWNGRVDRCCVRDDICQLVQEEWENRLNDRVVFFTAGRYSDYGVPLFAVEHHYFSRYE